MQTTIQLYCGNLECATRQTDPPTLFTVKTEDVPDGELWLCPVCRARARVAELDEAIKRATP